MNKGNSMGIDRSVGAEAISAKAHAIGAELGIAISKCAWDFGTDLSHEYAHRLDVNTATSTVRLYFSDLDLTMSGIESRKERVEDRLRRAIAQLVTRVPASTYTQT